MTIYDLSSIDDIVDSPLDRSIYLATNECGYTVPAHDLMKEWVDPMLLKDKYVTSK